MANALGGGGGWGIIATIGVACAGKGRSGSGLGSTGRQTKIGSNSTNTQTAGAGFGNVEGQGGKTNTTFIKGSGETSVQDVVLWRQGQLYQYLTQGWVWAPGPAPGTNVIIVQTVPPKRKTKTARHRQATRQAKRQHFGLVKHFIAPGQLIMPVQDLLTYFPPMSAFFSQSMDVYTGNATVPAPAGNKRTTAANISITGTFLEGSRQRVQASFSYSHIIICDPAIEIRDGYTGDTNAETQASQDQLMIPTGQTANVWLVILSFVTILPGIGRKKIILADRKAAGTWTTLV